MLITMIRGFLALLVVGAGVWGLTAPDGAGQTNPFRELLGQSERERVEQSQWFERADGRGRFILDRSVRPALLWREGEREVFAVNRTPAAGGGEIWLTDTDQVLLRKHNPAGWTFFPEDRRDGVIVEPVGRAQTLVAEPADAEALQDAAREMVDRMARASRNEVAAELTSLTPEQNAYIIDAMVMAAFGVEAASRRAVRDLEIVRIGIGETPQARFDGRVLDISVATELGYGGRPSSDYIRRTLERGAD